MDEKDGIITCAHKFTTAYTWYGTTPTSATRLKYPRNTNPIPTSPNVQRNCNLSYHASSDDTKRLEQFKLRNLINDDAWNPAHSHAPPSEDPHPLTKANDFFKANFGDVIATNQKPLDNKGGALFKLSGACLLYEFSTMKARGSKRFCDYRVWRV